jgi:hypothetical protein
MREQCSCPKCQSVNISYVHRTSPGPLAANLVADGERVHVPRFWRLRCQTCGQEFERDVAIFEGDPPDRSRTCVL